MVSRGATMRAVRLDVEDQGQRFVDELHLFKGEHASGFTESIEVHCLSWSHMTRVCWFAMATCGRKLVWRALVLVKATTHVLRLNHPGWSTTANRRPSARDPCRARAAGRPHLARSAAMSCWIARISARSTGSSLMACASAAATCRRSSRQHRFECVENDLVGALTASSSELEEKVTRARLNFHRGRGTHERSLLPVDRLGKRPPQQQRWGAAGLPGAVPVFASRVTESRAIREVHHQRQKQMFAEMG